MGRDRWDKINFPKANYCLLLKSPPQAENFDDLDSEFQDPYGLGQEMKSSRNFLSQRRAGQRRAGQGQNLKRRAGRPVCPAL